MIRINVAATLAGFFQDYQRSIDTLRAGLIIDPLEAEYYRWIGRMQVRKGDLEAARISLQRSIELAPDNPNAYGTMTELEMEIDNLPGALDWMRQASEIDRQDHELAGNIARDLYYLDLPEEGDYWLSRVQTLAPRSGIARALEVARAAAREDTEQALALASALIAEQVEDRQGTFGETVFYYMDTMLEQGRAEEAYNFLVSVRPEITRYDEVAPGLHGLILQWASIGLMSGFRPENERLEAWTQFTDAMTELGFPWNLDPSDSNITWDLLMRGQTEEAIEHYLEYEMQEPLAKNLDRHRKRFSALYGPVYDDPRAAAKLIEDAKRYAELREQVREMLQRPEWSNP
jgi:tetratricopeptide (TPR) repeat protein